MLLDELVKACSKHEKEHPNEDIIIEAVSEFGREGRLYVINNHAYDSLRMVLEGLTQTGFTSDEAREYVRSLETKQIEAH